MYEDHAVFQPQAVWLWAPEKCPVYLLVTYSGKVALTLETNVCITVKNCYEFVAVQTLFVSGQLLFASWKDVWPVIPKNSIIY